MTRGAYLYNLGQAVTVMWRGKPIFIRHRTAKEIEEAKAVALDELPDPIARNANLPSGSAAPSGGAKK